MLVVKSKIIGETIVVAAAKEDFEEATKKADELNSAVYTQREVDFLHECAERMDPDERKKWLCTINLIKKKFLGFVKVPKDWRAPR